MNMSMLQSMQVPAALLCVLVMVAGLMGYLPLPEAAMMALSFGAGALGIKRPSETAAMIAAALQKASADEALERLKAAEESAKASE